MKSFIAVMAFGSALAASPAWAQAPSGSSIFGGQPKSAPVGGPAAAPRDNSVIKSGTKTPDLTPASRSQAPEPRFAQRADRALPFDQGKRSVHGAGEGISRRRRRTDGPGPRQGTAQRIQFARVHPPNQRFSRQKLDARHSPTVPSNVMTPDIKMPEKIRTFDEAAVLVGNEKTLKGSEQLWQQVRKIKPACLQQHVDAVSRGEKG